MQLLIKLDFKDYAYHIHGYFCLHFLSGVCGYPQGLRGVCNDPEEGSITFGWKAVDCERMNGLLLGYEVKLHYDEETRTERVVESVTTYTISPLTKPGWSYPKAISVAAVNEVGVGDYSPPVKIDTSGS